MKKLLILSLILLCSCTRTPKGFEEYKYRLGERVCINMATPIQAEVIEFKYKVRLDTFRETYLLKYVIDSESHYEIIEEKHITKNCN